jgi:hypothetical protein
MSIVTPIVHREPATLVALMSWTYRRQRADEMTGKALAGEKGGAAAEPRPGWSLDGCYRIEAISRLGCKIDGGGWQRPAVHADAEALHDCVVALSQSDWIGARLVQRYGRQGTVPDWHPQPQRLVPSRDARGRPRVVEVGRVRVKGRDAVILASPLRLDPEDSYIGSLRHEYTLWHCALTRIQAMRPMLARWRITELGAAACPWGCIKETLSSQ